jgi:Secretion system C-terminal sorting domain
MKFAHAIFLILFSFQLLMAQTFLLGPQISNGVTTGGCATGCASFCIEGGTGNHAVATCTQSVNVPAGQYLSVGITTNACHANAGLDAGDFIQINAVNVVTGASNLVVNYTGCFFNNSASTYAVPINLIANRRDETVTVVATISATPCAFAAALPVSLTSLQAKPQANSIDILFATEMERNLSHFEIEHSLDGVSWIKIGEVKGTDHSNALTEYRFIDANPVNGVNYYRLKMTDFNTDFSYSSIVSARFGQRSTLTIVPTLVIDQINVTLPSDHASGNWAIIDQNGRIALAGQTEAEEEQFTADLSNLQSGMYIVRVQLEGEVITERVMKL